MFNEGKFDSIIAEYKKQFIQSQWPKEKFKREAVKCFQDNWDIDADNFTEMLKKSLAKTENLLSSKNNFPKDIIINLAKLYPNEVCKMFIELFDESKNIYKRISTFKENSEALFKKSEETDNRHYQTENAITTYLWLRYPDKYYIYKFSEAVAVSNELESNYIFKRGEFANNIENFFDFYDEICSKLQSDTELKSMLNSVITDTCYPDLELKTLTIDVGFFISRYYSNENDSDNISELNYWLLTADPQKFSLANASIGEIIDYSLRNSNGNKRRIFQNFLNAKEGDIVFGYEFVPTQKIVAILEVSAEQDDENIYFKKLETLSSPISLEILEKYVKLKNMEFFKNMRGTLFKITEEEFEIIMDIICKENPSLLLKYTDDSEDKNIISETSTNLSLKQIRKYTKEDFLEDVYISEEKYDKLVMHLKERRILFFKVHQE